MRARVDRRCSRGSGWRLGIALTCATLVPLASCHRAPAYRTFPTPEDAVRALTAAVKAENLREVVAIFGPEGQTLIDSSDATTARRNRQVFAAAVAERWRLEEQSPSRRVLVIGNEDWPFPVPLVNDAGGWRFDTAGGKEEVIARRIGRNELGAILSCRAYVVAQRLYAERGHDGRPAGVYAASFWSDAGRENGLYWPAKHGQKRSPLGDLLAQAAAERTSAGAQRPQRTPFNGYYFKILTGQGPAAPGGAKDYVVNGAMSGGFALVSWPAQYDATGVMTFTVNQDGTVREKDLGRGTDAAVEAMRLFNPDDSWATVQ
jgi:Protein of unknown function (DUF2950)